MAADFSVRLVNGVAGSGKTLIAISRALLLAELFPRQRILVLIHNTPIVADLAHRLRRARGGLPGNVEMLTFFAWIAPAMGPRVQRLPAARPAPRADRTARAARPLAGAGAAVDAHLADELDFINDNLLLRRSRRTWPPAAPAAASRCAAERGASLGARRRARAGAAALRPLPWSALPREICVEETRGATCDATTTS